MRWPALQEDRQDVLTILGMQLFQGLHKRSLGGAIYVCSIQRGHGRKSRAREFGQWMPDQLTENPICNPTDNGNYTEQQNLDPLHCGSRPMNFWWYNVGDDVVEYSATVQQQTSSPCPRWRNRRPLYCELDPLASTTYTLVQDGARIRPSHRCLMRA